MLDFVAHHGSHLAGRGVATIPALVGAGRVAQFALRQLHLLHVAPQRRGRFRVGTRAHGGSRQQGGLAHHAADADARAGLGAVMGLLPPLAARQHCRSRVVVAKGIGMARMQPLHDLAVNHERASRNSLVAHLRTRSIPSQGRTSQCGLGSRFLQGNRYFHGRCRLLLGILHNGRQQRISLGDNERVFVVGERGNDGAIIVVVLGLLRLCPNG